MDSVTKFRELFEYIRQNGDTVEMAPEPMKGVPKYHSLPDVGIAAADIDGGRKYSLVTVGWRAELTMVPYPPTVTFSGNMTESFFLETRL